MTDASAPRVGLVFVSHSDKIATGLVDLARQMAGTVAMAPAGGTDDGGVGTSFEKVRSGIEAVDAGAGVVLLCDLGSAILTAQTALELLDDPSRDDVRIADAPLVEGAVAASVAAESGGDLSAVIAAAESANRGAEPGEEAAVSDSAAPDTTAYLRTVTLVNSDGLHARPAAEFVKLANTFPVKVTVNGSDAKSLLGIMSLGLVRGARVDIASSDPGAQPAVDSLAALIESGFGEE